MPHRYCQSATYGVEQKSPAIFLTGCLPAYLQSRRQQRGNHNYAGKAECKVYSVMGLCFFIFGVCVQMHVPVAIACMLDTIIFGFFKFKDIL